MKILVTGGAGFLGSHICRVLAEQGHTVLIYDDLSTGKQELIDPKALFLQGDIMDSDSLEKVLVGVDVVIHLAAFSLVEESVKDPLKYVENNIKGSTILLEAMRKTGVKRIIFSSSATVYGQVDKKSLPLKEDSPVQAVNPYGASKVAVESMLSSYFFNYGFDVTILRYFNPFGPGEMHDPETHAVPNFIRAALNKEPLPLYGKGELVRDFIYVEDLARAHTAVLNLNGWNIFNVGTEKGVKVIEVVKTIEQILGYKVEINDLGDRAGDVPATYASSKKLIKETKWKPRFTLKEGLEKTVAWFQNK
jgi:UDP-glucose-4-epimerase GalE